MKNNVTAGRNVYMGGVAGIFRSGSVVNVHVKANLNSTQTAATYVCHHVGGIAGYVNSAKIYKSSYTGTIYVKIAAASISKNDDGDYIGGIIGRPYGDGSTVVIDTCAVTGTVSAENCGAGLGGILGCSAFSNSWALTVTNVMLNVAVKMLGPTPSGGTVNVNDTGLLFGEDPFQDKGTSTSKTLKVENIYVMGNSKTYLGSSDTSGSYTLTGREDNGPTDVINACASHIYLPIASGTTIYPSKFNSATSSTEKKGSTGSVGSSASNNSNMNYCFKFDNYGATGSKLNSTGNIGSLAFYLLLYF